MRMAKSSFRKPVPVASLRWRCAPSRFRVASTADAEPLTETIGQERALEALKLGLELYGPGYNVFVAGLPGLGKSSLVQGVLEEMTPHCALPPDRVYVNNFRYPERPRLLELPRGDGQAFAREMERATETIAESIRRLSDDEAFAKRREEVVARQRDEERRLIDAFEKAAREAGFVAGSQQAGPVAEPELFHLVGDQPVAMGDLDDAVRLGKVPAEAEEGIRETYRSLRQRLGETIRRSRALARERQRAIEALDREVAGSVVAEAAADLRSKFPYPTVANQLREAQAHFVERFPAYARALFEASGELEARPEGLRLAAEEVFREFRVNLLLDAFARKGCPIVVEQHPTWTNLFGQIEREPHGEGSVRSDFLLIRAGSLLRADAGYLVLQAKDVLAEEGVWDELKRVLKHGRLEIRVPEAQLATAPIALHPDPIPLNVKVVLIGDEETYQALHDADPEFSETFKVKATFERDTPLTDEALHRYARFFRKTCAEEGLLHLDRSGLAAVAEEGVREAGRQGRLSVRFGRMTDLVREAGYVARRRGAGRITGVHVVSARRAAAARLGVEERRVREAIREGLLLLDTSGRRVGQVNGLAIYDFGDHRFGKVARITAAVGPGQAGILNVEREASLSGATHDKGVLILSGYLREALACGVPLAFTASLAFEQSYGGISGDSATCAETFALLSALSRLPARQDLAVTGSMNQHGDVQAVGDVNDKVEGFFDLCAERGLTGTQGVVIPRANVRDLMLREDVVEACRARSFAVYAIDRVEEGIELLTGVPAGVTAEPGEFRPKSVFAAVAARLVEFAEACARYPGAVPAAPPAAPAVRRRRSPRR
jgi:ATP-dependent Lon protease